MPEPALPELLRLVLAGGRLAPRRQLLSNHCGDARAAMAAGPGGWRAAGLSEAQVAALRSGYPGAEPETVELPCGVLMGDAEDLLAEHLAGCGRCADAVTEGDDA